MKGALSMVDNPDYRECFGERELNDINEILRRNDYHSPEESDLDNDPNAPVKSKRIFIYKLSWRTEEVSQETYTYNVALRN